MGTPVQSVLPRFFPHLVVLLKHLFPFLRQALHQRFQLPGGKQPGIKSEVTLDNLFHVILAHLDLIGGKHVEKALYTINDDSLYRIPPGLDVFHRILVVLHFLVLDEFDIQRSASLMVYRKKDAPVLPSVSHVQMDIAGTGQRRLMPFYADIAKAALNGGGTDTISRSQF